MVYLALYYLYITRSKALFRYIVWLVWGQRSGRGNLVVTSTESRTLTELSLFEWSLFKAAPDDDNDNGQKNKFGRFGRARVDTDSYKIWYENQKGWLMAHLKSMMIWN